MLNASEGITSLQHPSLLRLSLLEIRFVYNMVMYPKLQIKMFMFGYSKYYADGLENSRCESWGLEKRSGVLGLFCLSLDQFLLNFIWTKTIYTMVIWLCLASIAYTLFYVYYFYCFLTAQLI